MDNPYQPPGQPQDARDQERRGLAEPTHPPQQISRLLYTVCFFLPILLLLAPFVFAILFSLVIELLRWL